MNFGYIIFILIAAVGFLASVFDWEWYFRLSRKSRRWDDLMGREANRILNAVSAVIVFIAATAMIFSETA